MKNYSKKDKEERFDKLVSLKTELEQREMVVAYLAYLQLSPVEKIQLAEEYEVYYEKCKQTPSYANYLEMRDAVKRQDSGLIKTLFAEARIIQKNMVRVQKPKMFSKEEIYNSSDVSRYRSCIAQLREIAPDVYRAEFEVLYS